MVTLGISMSAFVIACLCIGGIVEKEYENSTVGMDKSARWNWGKRDD